MRIVQLANFVAPHSGGIRTVLEHLATGYAELGHEVVQLVPGPARHTAVMPWGRREVLHGWPMGRTGYRILRPATAFRALSRERPDRIEVHDRSTLRGVGRWAARRGVPAVVVVHERLDRLAWQWLPRPLSSSPMLGRLVEKNNAALAAGFAAVVCTTGWAAAEFDRLPAVTPHVVPLGVDTRRFGPDRADPSLRSHLTAGGEPLLVLTSRLSREKHPELALSTVAELARRGVPAKLVVIGDGPERSDLMALAARDRLPVRFLGHLPQPELARWLASADVAIAPGPVETFCLAALESLASGTPVVGHADSAVSSILGSAGLVAPGRPEAFADAVSTLLALPAGGRRAAARERALEFGWDVTVAGMLAVPEVGIPSDPASIPGENPPSPPRPGSLPGVVMIVGQIP